MKISKQTRVSMLIALLVIAALAISIILILTLMSSFINKNSLPGISAGVISFITLVSLFFYWKVKFQLRLGIAMLIFLLSISTNIAQKKIEDMNTTQMEKKLSDGLVGLDAPALAYSQIINPISNPEFDLNEFEGRVTVINFWAKWCPPCIKEMKELEEFHLTKNDQILLLGITGHYRSFEREDTVKSLQLIKALLEKKQVTYPILIDDGTANWEAYHAYSLPVSILINKNRQVIDYRIGIKGTKRILSKARELAKD